MSKDREARRKDVAKLLEKGLDAKLQRASWERALEKLEKAYALAQEEPALPSPWPALTAYRLAHVRMRKGDLTLEVLQAIEKLFEAARNPCLGALPFVYQVAALRRMKDYSGADASELDGRIDEVMKAAFDALNRYDAYHRNVEYSLNDDEEEEEDDESVSHRSAPVTESMLQYNAFNLLELAAYFVGHDSRQWDGYGNLPQSDHLEVGTTQAPWRVVGSGIAEVRCSEVIAREELKARSKEHPDALVLWLPEGGKKRAVYWKGRSCGKLNRRLAALLLYPHMVRARSLTKVSIVQEIFGGSSSLYSHTVGERGEKDLREILDCKEGPVLVDTKGYHQLPSDKPVLGAIHIDCLRD